MRRRTVRRHYSGSAFSPGRRYDALQDMGEVQEVVQDVVPDVFPDGREDKSSKSTWAGGGLREEEGKSTPPRSGGRPPVVRSGRGGEGRCLDAGEGGVCTTPPRDKPSGAVRGYVCKYLDNRLKDKHRKMNR